MCAPGPTLCCRTACQITLKVEEPRVPRLVFNTLLKNFGELEFDWNSHTVVMRSIGKDGRPLLSAKWSMDHLSGKIAVPDGLVTREEFVAEQKLVTNGGEWTCINHRGRVNEMSIIAGHLATAASMLFMFSVPQLLLGSFIARCSSKSSA